MNKGFSSILLGLVVLFAACGEQPSTPTPDLAPPTVESFSADAEEITAGQSTTLRWRSVSAGATLRLEPGMGEVTGKNSVKVSPTETTTYTLTATNDAGSRDYEQTVTVSPKSDPDPNDPVPSNEAPVASDGGETTPEDTALTVQLSASDADGDALTYSIVAEPVYGLLSDVDASSGRLTYTPNAGYVGVDSFTFKVSDGGLESAEATVSLTVTARTPVFSGVENAAVEKTGGELSFDVSDPDSSEITVTASSSNDTVVANSGLSASCVDGACSLTVSPLATGDTTLSLTATNAAGYSATATLELSVFDKVVETLEDSGEGSLRDTLEGAAAGEVVGLPESLSGQTLTLSEPISLSKDVTLEGDVTVEGSAGASVFSISESATVTLKDLKITGGSGAGLRTLNSAGSALYNQGTLILAGGLSVSNVSGASAIVNEGTLTLQDSVNVSANSGGTQGGGVYNSGTLVLKDNVSVRGNSAAAGGGVYNSGTLTLQDNATVGANKATTGGGIYNMGGVVVKGDASVSGNTVVPGNSYTAGGGIYNSNNTFNEGSGVVRLEERASVSGNSAPTGGGVYSRYGTLILKGEASVSANLAVYGAGIYSDEAFLSLEDAATISSNGDADTSLGGGIYAYRGFYQGLDFDGEDGDDNVFGNAHSQVYFDQGQNQ